MARTIKVHTFGLLETEIQEVTLQEAERILFDTYNNDLGGLVVDGKTHEVIGKIGPEVEEIIVIQTALDGG